MNVSKVVVNVKIVTIPHPDDDIFIARMNDLPLTAYGSTPGKAIENVKQMFGRFINAHRQRGTLEDVLDRSGVIWYREGMYPSDQPAYEDLGLRPSPELDLASAVQHNRLTIMDHIKSQNLVDWIVTADESDNAELMVAA